MLYRMIYDMGGLPENFQKNLDARKRSGTDFGSFFRASRVIQFLIFIHDSNEYEE